MKRITTILIILTLLTSCDCVQKVTGIVVDKQTGKPLEGVTVYKKNRESIKSRTDKNGHFELSAISGGFHCPPMKVIAQLKNYSTVELSIPPDGNEIITMQPLAFQPKTTLELIQGAWYHDKDSMATLTINQKLWTFNYKGEQPNPNDSFSISLTDRLPEYVKEKENAEFLILTNKSDTLKYEILGITESTFNLMYFPAGKIHLYNRLR